MCTRKGDTGLYNFRVFVVIVSIYTHVHVRVCVHVCVRVDVLKDYKARLKSLSEEVKILAKRSLGEPLSKSTKTLVDTVQKTVQGKFSSTVYREYDPRYTFTEESG